MPEDEPLALDYFSGGVPTGEFFRMTLDDVSVISEADNSDGAGINRLQELCFIGLLSYFEAFCKDQFAALVNLEPSLITNLKTAGQDVSVDAAHVTMYGDESNRRMGFLLASKYDFGTAQKINSLFGALLRITPFSKDEARRFDRLLLDRNLLVHHGGTLTLKYLEQVSQRADDVITDAFMNSRVVGRTEVAAAVQFIEQIARKLLRASHAGLTTIVSRSDEGRRKVTS